MAEIKARMAELKTLHGRAALTTFDDSRGAEAEVEVATAEITRLFRRCEARLTGVGPALGAAGRAASEADERVRQNVRRTLAGELQALVRELRQLEVAEAAGGG